MTKKIILLLNANDAISEGMQDCTQETESMEGNTTEKSNYD